MADGKWITGLTPETSATEAARQVLAVRLEVVARLLPLAVENAAEDIEHVHQLRVATRRAGAAVRIFSGLLPKRDRKTVNGVLRAVRRAAGEARDWDVFLQALDRSAALAESPAQPASVFLTGYALGHRAAAQAGLTAAVQSQKDAANELARQIPDAVRSPKGADPITFADLAADQLGALFSEFAAEIAAGPSSPHDLHQLRITAKRVRYAMEVFAGCYGPQFRDLLYPEVERMQELLGVVQDGHVAAGRLTAVKDMLAASRPSVAEAVLPGVEALAREQEAKAAGAETQFREWVLNWESLTAGHPLPGLVAVYTWFGVPRKVTATAT